MLDSVPSAAIYTRISKDVEGRSEGVKTQERKGRKLAAELFPDLPVVVYVDNDVSAASPGTHRPGYEALVAAIRRGDVAQVLAAEQSRLTRQVAEWEELTVVLARAGIDAVHTYRAGRIEVGRSKLLGRILAAVDAEEVERLRLRITDKLDALAAEGRPPGGRPFGYRAGVDELGRKTLEVDEAEADAIRWAAGAVLGGWSLTNVAATLAAQGVPTARGGRWSSTTVRAVLTKPSVAGLRVHRGEIVGRATWAAIIDEATWRQVTAVLGGPATVQRSDGGTYQVSRRRRPARRYLLTGGLARCGRCNAPLVAQQRSSRTAGSAPAYLCHPTRGGCSGIGIGAEPLEAYVAEQLLEELDRPDFLRELAADDDGAREAVTTQLGQLEERRAELARMWAAGTLSAGEWTAARTVLESDQHRLQGELAGLPSPTIDVDPAVIREGWGLMTLDERRQVLALFIESVVVGPAQPGTRRFDPDRVRVAWR